MMKKIIFESIIQPIFFVRYSWLANDDTNDFDCFATFEKKVKSWTNDIRNGVTPNLADFIQNTKGFLNPYLLTRTCKEFRIDEYSTNFTNFKQNLADAQRHKNSYLALRDRQNAQIEQHQKRKQKREESVTFTDYMFFFRREGQFFFQSHSKSLYNDPNDCMNPK